MKIKPFSSALCVALSFALQTGCADSSSQSLTAHSEALTARKVEQPTSHKEQMGRQANDEQSISKEQAIAIAKEDAAKTYPSLDASNAIACEQRTLWLVMFDGGGVESYIAKDSGKVLLVQKLPQLLNVAGTRSVGNGISKAKAIETAEKHFGEFLASYGDSKEHAKEYETVACELSNAWRVFFEYRMKPGETLATMPNTNPPNYVIDKGTSEITYTSHHPAP